MSKKDLVLAIDQGTTSTRAIVFSIAGEAVTTAQRRCRRSSRPTAGWSTTRRRSGRRRSRSAARSWPRSIPSVSAPSASPTSARPQSSGTATTGKPVHNAIVWQDRRAAPLCRKLIEAGHEPMVQQKTGLLIDSYFSATKIAWLLENVSGAKARRRARRARLRHDRQLSPLAPDRRARCMRPTSPMPAAPCCSTSTAGTGMTGS